MIIIYAHDLAQDKSTVKARNVKNFLHFIRPQNIMLNEPHDEMGHEKRWADQDLKFDPITNKYFDEIYIFYSYKIYVYTCVLFPSLLYLFFSEICRNA